MNVKSRIKKLEERSGNGFIVLVPKIEYLGEGDDCTGAIARWKDEFVHQSERREDEMFDVFRARFAEEYKDACRLRLGGKSKTVVVLDEDVDKL